MTTATAPLFTLPDAEPSAAPRPAPPGAPRGGRVRRLAHGRLSLDELVSGAWAAVSAGSPAACPVCDGTLRRPHAGPAECARCGAELA